MANTEPATASLGPRYAPDDPTLPQPWKGLIDGSTGILYYWNPETNITQYERPSSLPPLLPQSQPPPVSAAGSNIQPGGSSGQGGEQVSHVPSHQELPTNSSSMQHPQVIPQAAQQSSSVLAQAGQQQVSQLGLSAYQQLQLSSQQLSQQPVQQPYQQQFSQPQQSMQQMHQFTGQQASFYQGSQMGQHPGHEFPHQQMSYMAYQQQSSYLQGQQSSPQQACHVMQHPPHPHPQEHKSGFQHGEETDSQQGKQIGFSPSQIQQPGGPSFHKNTPGANSIQMQQMGVQPGQAQPFGSSALKMQQPAPLGPQPQNRINLAPQHHGPRFQNQFESAMMHAQQPHASPINSNIPLEENAPRRVGNEYYFNASNNGPGMPPHQPKLAAIPMARNQQDMRIGGPPMPNVTPGMVAGQNSGLHNMYGPSAGGPGLQNSMLMRPPTMVMESSDAMNISTAEMYMQKHEVTTTGGNVPAPFMTFESTGFPPEILREMQLAGFTSPTPIQAQTWPVAIQNRDVVAIAKTGSGKTLGYLIPAFMLLRYCRNNPQNGPTVLVLAPTRELATQIQDEAIKFGRSSRVSCTCLYGGAPKGPQLKELDRGADIVVATPGRLNDILEMKKIEFSQVSLLVLDEADRMLDMGFEPQIRTIVNAIPPRRQTLMYTATWPKEVRKIASDLLRNPVQVNIGNADELAANKAITQYVEMVPYMEKQRRLEQILKSQERGSKVIIFCSTKRLCDQLARSLGRSFGAAAIHGDKSQVERDHVLHQFRTGQSPILVATDVAARGLDIKDIRVVINYDFPTGIEDYVHRIGRTGRAGATGVSYTFFSDQDWKYAPDLIKVLEGANQQVPEEIREIAVRGGPSFVKDRGGPNRFDSGALGGRWDSGGRGGTRDGGFGGRGGMRDGGFGGRGGMRDGGFGGRDGMRDGGFSGGRGGMRDDGFGGGRGGMRDRGFGGRGGGREGNFGSRGGGRDGGFGGRGGGRDGSFGGRGGMRDGFGGQGGGYDRYNMDGRGRGRGRGRFDNRRDIMNRSRGRSYSRSPQRVRTWGRSRSRSRSRSWSRSRSRSRSWSRSYSPRRSYSRSRSRSRSPSYERPRRVRQSKFDQMEPSQPEFGAPSLPIVPPLSPGKANAFPGHDLSSTQLTPPVENVEPKVLIDAAAADPSASSIGKT